MTSTIDELFSVPAPASPLEEVAVADDANSLPLKKRKREVPEFVGSDSQLATDFIAVKSLFYKNPEFFSEWQSKFASDMVRLEKRFGGEFYQKISPKQKTIIVETAAILNKKVTELENVVGDPKKKRTVIATLSAEDYAEAWLALKYIAEPCISSVEFNYLVNIAQKLREYKHKAVFSQMEVEFLKRMRESIPERIQKDWEKKAAAAAAAANL